MRQDDSSLSVNSIEVLKKRYLLKDDAQNVIESPDDLFRRVASHVAGAERKFKSSVRFQDAEKRFYDMMRRLEFLPNSPTLMNAATPIAQLSACFVLPVKDSIDGIFDSLKDMARIHQTGGGTGFSFSRLRPKGDLVSSTKGAASGPVSFMKIFDTATGVIVQGGRRRGANMGILRCDHPDIIEFITAKLEKNSFSNFNLSVGITDVFMEAVIKDRDYDLINPRTRRAAGKLKARFVFGVIARAAWKTGDPGLIFLDEINRRNPTPSLGDIEATNPCAELPLLPYESCNLGSINLSKMVIDGRPDWNRLRENIIWGVRFLDNVIETNKFPLREIKEMTLANRKIGLGVMGFADMLIKLGMSYNSNGAVNLALRLARFMRDEALKASSLLAKERGVFPNYRKSIYAKRSFRVRNATVNTIAPTGTISIIAGCSSGIEPVFALIFVRNILSGARLLEVNPIFEERIEDIGLPRKKIVSQVSKFGSLKGLKGIPERLKKVFVTALDIPPLQHLYIQSAFQRHTDNSVSKTINLPEGADVKDVKFIYMKAYKLKLKGITIYRYGSKKDQVLSFGRTNRRNCVSYGGLLESSCDG